MPQKCVHSLLLKTFVGDLPEGMECRHLDSDRMNCRLSNLKYGTKKENQFDRIGVNRTNRKLKPEEVSFIRRLYNNGIKQPILVKMFKMSKGSISFLVNNKSYCEVI